MKRTILALAIVGLSLPAFALPPPGAGSPLNVTVVNQPAVTVANTAAIPVAPEVPIVTPNDIQILTLSSSPEAGTETQPVRNILFGVVLTGVRLSINATGSSSGSYCMGIVSVEPPDGSTLPKSIAVLDAYPGEMQTEFIPLPNVFIATGSKVRLQAINLTDGAVCKIRMIAQGLFN